MAIITRAPLDAPASPYWTLDRYHRAIDAGVFADLRIELIAGALYEMPPMREPHIGATMFLGSLFSRALPWERVRIQTPIVLPADGEPEPDVAVTAPGASLKPSIAQVLLVIEVSHSTRHFDRGPKLEAYLADGVRELWIVDLMEQCALVYRGGVLVARHPRGAGAQLKAELVPDVAVDLDAVFAAAQLP